MCPIGHVPIRLDADLIAQVSVWASSGHQSDARRLVSDSVLDQQRCTEYGSMLAALQCHPERFCPPHLVTQLGQTAKNGVRTPNSSCDN